MPTERLIERGRLAYQALECREQAARYREAAVWLMEAIQLAENGDETKLQAFLDSMQLPEFNREIMFQGLAVPETKQPMAEPNSKGWDQMLDGIRKRASGVGTEPAVVLQSKPQPEKSQPAKPQSADQPAAKSIPENKPNKPTTQDLPQKPLPQKQTPQKQTPKKQDLQNKGPASLRASKSRPSKSSIAKPKLTKFGLDVWISLGVHGVLLVILGVWVVVTVKNTPTLSVVAATVESNDVLMETPMESVSPLESTSIDSASIASPDTSEIQIKVDTDAISVEKVDLGIASIAEASSVLQQMSKSGAPGTKLVEGAEFFGSKAVGNRFVYVVDASPSMRRDRAFDAAKEEILRSLQSMKPKQRFAILFFGGSVETLELVPGQKIDQPVSATQENIEKAVHWLRKITIQKDGKPPIDAIKSALELEPDGIFLLFDGDTKLDNWTQSVRRLNTVDGLLSDGAMGVPIHVIHFFRDEFQRSMQLLAQENGGTYRFVPKPTVRSLP